jgi:hypothetical protein
MYSLFWPKGCPAATWIAAQTGGTLLARRTVGDDYWVARCECGDSLADFLNYSSAFVTEQNGERHAHAIHVLHVQVCVTDTGCDKFYQNFTGPGIVDKKID